MSTPATPPTDPDSTKKIKSFLNHWIPLPGEAEDCPPDYVLIEISKEAQESERDAILKSLAAKAGKSKWPEHVDTCHHCKKIIALLLDKERPKITIQQIFAKASREAREVTSTLPHTSKNLDASFSFKPSRFFMITQRRFAATAAVAIVLLAGVWIAGNRMGYFKTSSRVATVVFERNESEELLATIAARSDQLKERTIPQQGKMKYIEEYNQTYQDVIALNRAGKLRPEDRGTVSKTMALYLSALKDRVESDQNHYPRRTPRDNVPITSDPDTATVVALFNNVDQAITKKNGGPTKVTPETADPGVIRTMADQIDVKSLTDYGVSIQDKVPDRNPEESKAFVKGVEAYAEQNARTVHLIRGTETRIIVPSAFARN